MLNFSSVTSARDLIVLAFLASWAVCFVVGKLVIMHHFGVGMAFSFIDEICLALAYCAACKSLKLAVIDAVLIFILAAALDETIFFIQCAIAEYKEKRSKKACLERR